MTRRRLGLCLLIPILTWTGIAAAEEGAVTGRLDTVAWSFGAWGSRYVGRACWLDESDGRWRLEVAQGDVGEADLLDQRGEGWCAVAVEDGRAFFQEWRGQLDPLAPSEIARLRVLMDLCGAAPGFGDDTPAPVMTRSERRAHGRRLPWSTESTGEDRVRILEWTADGPSDLRARLETRARGRGGAGEIWRCVGEPDGSLRISSSRRSGTLRVEPAGSRTVRYFPDDVYLPLWPLGEVLAAE